MVISFKIDNQVFLDFTFIEDRNSKCAGNDHYKMHLSNTHSLAKLVMDSNDLARINSWTRIDSKYFRMRSGSKVNYLGASLWK